MALKLVWTKRADQGYARTIKAKSAFIRTYRKQEKPLSGPINRLTILTYNYKPRKKEIVLVNIRGARQNPLKK